MTGTDTDSGSEATADTVLVLGVGGSGRTHRLRELAVEGAVWLPSTAYRPLSVDQVRAAVSDQPTMIVVDDAHWATTEALDALIDAISGGSSPMAFVASMGPWPSGPGHRAFADAMQAVGRVERLDRLDEAGVAAIVSGTTGRASSSELVEALLVATGGIAGWVADAVSTGFDGDLDLLPDQTSAAIVARLERQGDDAMQVLELAALDADPGRDIGVHAAVAADPDDAEAAVRASGALGADGACVAIVRRAIRHGLPSQRRRERHDQLARQLLDSDPAAAAEHLLNGSQALPDHDELLAEATRRVALTDAERCLDVLERAAEMRPLDADLTVVEATAAYWAGRHDVLGRLAPPDGAKRVHREQLLQLGFGIDVRDLRWAQAAERPVDADLRRFAAACLGRSDVAAADDGGDGSRPVSTAGRLAEGLTAVLEGRHDQGLEQLVLTADDADRSRWDVPIGITPHSIAALAALWIGDLPAAAGLVERAVELDSGGEGEARTHRLLAAYVGLLGGASADALAVVEAGDEPTWPQRDRLLVAAIDAAIARRSGDTQRLRDAWARSEAALLRPASSWLLLDPVLELLTAGARLDDERRVGPVAASLTEQLAAMPATGAGPAAAGWVDLQLGLARRDDDAVVAAADAIAATEPADPRSRARAVAARHWADLAQGRCEEDRAMAAMDVLVPVGDGWEASRLLGQTALDHENPQAARRLLEAARSLANDPADDRGNDGLVALGLSEREAEVAVLVTEGKTHREVGATLFISPKTVEHHVAKIRQKLGVATRADMMAVVRRATSGQDG